MSQVSLSWNELHTNYHNLVFSLALKSTQNYEDAEDLTQEVFLKIFGRLNNGIPVVLAHPEDRVRWLSAVTKNEAINFYRKKQREVQVIPLADLKFPSGQPIEIALPDPEQPPRINLNACGLTRAEKEAIQACYFEGLSNAAYAERLGVSIAAVKMRLFTARKKIAVAISKNPDLIES